MRRDEKQEALYTIKDLEVRTEHLLKRIGSQSHEAHQLRMMQGGLFLLRRFVDSVEVDILPEDVPPTTWDRYVEGM